MADGARVRLQTFSFAGPPERGAGLLGWIALEVDGLLVVDGIALRRTRRGRLSLSFPAPRDRQGRPRALIRPLDDTARQAIEAAVFEALGLEAAP